VGEKTEENVLKMTTHTVLCVQCVVDECVASVLNLYLSSQRDSSPKT